MSQWCSEFVFVWRRCIWNAIKNYLLSQSWAVLTGWQWFGPFLSLTALSWARAVVASSPGRVIFGFGSRCRPVVAGGTWRWSTPIRCTVCAPQHDTCAQAHPTSRSLDGVRFPSMPQLLRTLEKQTRGRTPRVTSATTGARCHRNINNISLAFSCKSYWGYVTFPTNYTHTVLQQQKEGKEKHKEVELLMIIVITD